MSARLVIDFEPGSRSTRPDRPGPRRERATALAGGLACCGLLHGASVLAQAGPVEKILRSGGVAGLRR